MADYANPGRDEATYMGVINTAATLAGTTAGYFLAGVTGNPLKQSMEIVGGEVGGSGLGTALTYNVVLFRASVEALMYGFGRDPKMQEEYMGLVAYTGRTEHWDEIQAKVDAELRH